MTRRLQVLFLLALLGVLVALGVLAAAVGGWPALVAYAVVALGLVLVGAARARRSVRRQEGHTCDCCTSTIHDEVTVL